MQSRKTAGSNVALAKLSGRREKSLRRRRTTRGFGGRNSLKQSPYMRIKTFVVTSGSREPCNGRRSAENSC
eukprot:8245718-Pyramimonas_sp.AAC.1